MYNKIAIRVNDTNESEIQAIMFGIGYKWSSGSASYFKLCSTATCVWIEININNKVLTYSTTEEPYNKTDRTLDLTTTPYRRA